MRRSKYYAEEFKGSSFLSCEKDTEAIIKRLFVDSKPYDEELKRLMLINTPDCLVDLTNQEYKDKIKEYINPMKLVDDGYIRLNPKLALDEHQNVKSYMIITFDNFVPNAENPQYRDCIVMIDVICHVDYWGMKNYQQRPIKIAGYVDSLLNGTKLSGIGRLNFLGMNEIVLSEELSGYCLMYKAVHEKEEDRNPNDENGLLEY